MPTAGSGPAQHVRSYGRWAPDTAHSVAKLALAVFVGFRCLDLPVPDQATKQTEEIEGRYIASPQ